MTVVQTGAKIDIPALLPVELQPGFLVRAAPRGEVDPTLLDRILIWEWPQPGELYVVSADVGQGLDADRCVAEVTRVGTVIRPNEQVAQFVSALVDPVEDFAKVLDTLGRLYTGSDGLPAVLAIEINGPGLATQSELQRHIGYDNLYVWEYEDAADPQRRRSTRVGWLTTQRTRAMMLTRYVKQVKTTDPNTGGADYVINSPHTLAELRDLQTDTGRIADAAADPSNSDSHDDCVMAGAIGIWVVGQIQESTMESAADTRRRKSEERARREYLEQLQGRVYDYRSMDYTTEEMAAGLELPDGYPGRRAG